MDKNIVMENEPIKLSGNSKIRVRGRHTEFDGCLAFDWVGSGFAFNFSGTGFILSLGKFESDSVAYVKVIIDGSRRQRFAVVNGSEKLIIEGLSHKRHRVEVLKVTESIAKLCFDEIVLLGNGAQLQNPPYNNPKKLEFIGDSITCGYGVIGPATQPSYHTYQQDNTYSYAFLTAEKLGAEGRYISVSGKGIFCNCECNRDDVKAVEYYEYQSRTGGICNDGWEPDVLVINIGTNDGAGNAPKEDFAVAAREMLEKARARYENAHIIWLYGMMNNGYAEIIRETVRKFNEEDKKIHFLLVEPITAESMEVGANGHPNVRANVRVSKILAKKIRSLTGWSDAKSTEEDLACSH